MPTSTVEDYLKCILTAQQRQPGTLVTMGQIGAALGVAPGTVTAMVKTLAESGLVAYEPYSGVRLSEAGARLATHVQRRHRLIELFLVRKMGYDWSEVHDEAERLEHAVSDRLIERIDEMLGHPSADPHGDPIPDREGTLPASSGRDAARLPAPSAAARGARGRPERRVPAPAREAGAGAGEPRGGRVAQRGGRFGRARGGGGARVSLGFRAASKIFVEPAAEARR